jgi:hypothetical protein
VVLADPENKSVLVRQTGVDGHLCGRQPLSGRDRPDVIWESGTITSNGDMSRIRLSPAIEGSAILGKKDENGACRRGTPVAISDATRRAMTRTTIAAAVMSGLALALASSTAYAAPGDTSNICATTSTPTGWVDTAWYYSSACSTGSFNNNTHTIKQVAGYGAGTTVGACGSSLPPTGWVDTAWYYSSACSTGSFNNNTHTIKQLAGYPIGTTVAACGSSLPPAGWVDTAWYYSSACSTGSFNNNTHTIKRVY